MVKLQVALFIWATLENMRSHVMGCAICNGFYYVIDVSGNLWKGSVTASDKTPKIVEQQDLPQITSVVASHYGKLILLDIDGMIWHMYESSRHGEPDKFEKINGIDGIKSVAVAKFPAADVIFALNFEGLLYEIEMAYDHLEKITKIENLPPIEYISAYDAIAAKDFDNEIWYKASVGKQFAKIPLASGIYASDLIVEDKNVKFIDLDGRVWKYPQSVEIDIPFLLFANLPKFQILYGSGKHGFALDINNDLWGWGNNYNGQIHYEISDPRVYSPRKLSSDHRWKYIYCGDSASILISEEGEVYLWCNHAQFKIPEIERAFIGKAPAKSARK